MEKYLDSYEELYIELPEELHNPRELTAIFNNHLNGSQKTELSRIWAIPVIDRDDLILEIFEKNARTRQSKLQVELARLQLMAGIVKLEYGEHVEEKQGRDFMGKGLKGWEPRYRAYRERRRQIAEELEKYAQDRHIRRKKRSKKFNIGIIGYTNAGKSTLFNNLTPAEVETANEEFTTVSTTSRKLMIPQFDKYGNWEGQEVILTDSVGFVQNMSKIILDAFLSTLEELDTSDMILIVLDVSEKDVHRMMEKLETTFKVMNQIGTGDLPKLLVLNKSDTINSVLLDDRKRMIRDTYEGVQLISISALNKEGFDDLKSLILEFKEKYHSVYKNPPKWKEYVDDGV